MVKPIPVYNCSLSRISETEFVVFATHLKTNVKETERFTNPDKVFIDSVIIALKFLLESYRFARLDKMTLKDVVMMAEDQVKRQLI